MFKLFAILALGFVITGCGEPPQIEIDIDEAAANAGLAPEDYKVHEDGTIQVYSKVDASEE